MIKNFEHWARTAAPVSEIYKLWDAIHSKLAGVHEVHHTTEYGVALLSTSITSFSRKQGGVRHYALHGLGLVSLDDLSQVRDRLNCIQKSQQLQGSWQCRV